MIALDNIVFRYPNSDFRLAFKNLSFKAGEKTAVIGPSGFGKTTLLNLISGINLPEDGQIIVGTTQVHRLSESQRRTFRLVNIGFVFQDFRLLNYLNVLDNILLPFRINGAIKFDKSARESAKKLSDALGIGDKLTKYPGRLSQGERQRVAICRALINRPGIILADEPTGNLDPDNKHRIMSLLFDQVTNYNATLITVTHDHALLPGFDRVVDFKNIQQF